MYFKERKFSEEKNEKFKERIFAIIETSPNKLPFLPEKAINNFFLFKSEELN